MKRSERQRARDRANGSKSHRAARLATEREMLAALELGAREALARPVTGAARVVESALASPWLEAPLFRRLTGLPHEQPATRPPKLDALLRAVAKRGPRIIDPDYGAAFYWIATLRWLRPLDAWEPKGKGRDTQFQSLVAHLLARYPTPPFLWSGFFSDDAPVLAPVIAHVAAGGSLAQAAKTGVLPVALTRQMSHELLRTPSEVPLVEAIRRVQVASVGGDLRLLRAWMATSVGRALQGESEPFWQVVLAWLARNPMLDRQHVGPIVDYVRHRREHDPAFSMKGRSALALLRAMRAWHAELRRAPGAAATTARFEPSGFQAGRFDRSRRSASGNVARDIWTIDELLTARALLEEGRAMKHCVYSYARAVETRSTSIWAMTHESDGGAWKQLTIEVRNDLRRVVQARGVCNRVPTAIELNVLTSWAQQNRLEVAVERL